jgi:hypothetical protein
MGKQEKTLNQIFRGKQGVTEIINIQSAGSKAKPYQVKQIRSIFLKYKLAGE